MALQLRKGLNSLREVTVFSEGEPVWTTDTNKLYIGDGITLGGIEVASGGSGSTNTFVTAVIDKELSIGTGTYRMLIGQSSLPFDNQFYITGNAEINDRLYFDQFNLVQFNTAVTVNNTATVTALRFGTETAITSRSELIGPTGPAGSTGATGAQGPTGPQGSFSGSTSSAVQFTNTLTVTGGDGAWSSIVARGYNQRGGTGYHGFLETTNTYGSATNANKFFRLNSTGDLQIINSAYSANIFNLTDGGDLTVNGLTANGTTTLKGLKETIYDWGNVSAGTYTPDVSSGTVHKMVLTGNVTISALANVSAGSSVNLILTQDGSGGKLLTSTMKFAGGSKTLSTAAGSIDTISVFYDGTNYLASLVKGYA